MVASKCTLNIIMIAWKLWRQYSICKLARANVCSVVPYQMTSTTCCLYEAIHAPLHNLWKNTESFPKCKLCILKKVLFLMFIGCIIEKINKVFNWFQNRGNFNFVIFFDFFLYLKYSYIVPTSVDYIFDVVMSFSKHRETKKRPNTDFLNKLSQECTFLKAGQKELMTELGGRVLGKVFAQRCEVSSCLSYIG